MAKVLVHLTHGPEQPTRAALAFFVARSAAEAGHEVSLFLAGDAVQLMRSEVLDNLAGLGTGRLREHYDALVAADCPFYLSGMSCKTRGMDESQMPGNRPRTSMAMPKELVELALEHDRMFTY